MKLSLVIPAYNEEGSIASVVRALNKAFFPVEPSFEIIVVDNGSSDRTPAILVELSAEIPVLRTVRVEVNRGYGNGVIAGLRETTGDILGWVDADNQVRPEDVAAVYRAIRDGQADLAKARRGSRPESHFRAFQSSVFNLIFRSLFGGNFSDINAKPKLFRRSLWEVAHLSSLDFFIDAELMIKAIRQRARVREVEVIWVIRTTGRSSVHFFAGIEFLKNMLRYKFFGD